MDDAELFRQMIERANKEADGHLTIEPHRRRQNRNRADLARTSRRVLSATLPRFRSREHNLGSQSDARGAS